MDMTWRNQAMAELRPDYELVDPFDDPEVQSVVKQAIGDEIAKLGGAAKPRKEPVVQITISWSTADLVSLAFAALAIVGCGTALYHALALFREVTS